MKYIQRFFATAAISLVVFAGLGLVPASAQAASTKETVCSAIGSGADCNDTVNGGKKGDLSSIVKVIINVLSIAVGVIAIVMIIIAGAKYITSGGDSNKIASAKNSLVYALIGLIIVALSQTMVRFVLRKATDTTSTPAAPTCTAPLKLDPATNTCK